MLITDTNPTLSARAIPIELIEGIASDIKLGYEFAQQSCCSKITVMSPLNRLVHADLSYSHKNCEWYNTFYQELYDIANISGVFKIPELTIDKSLIKSDSLSVINPLSIHSPLLDEYYKDLIVKNITKYNELSTNICALSRVMLVDLEPSFEDFVKGTPVWLIESVNPILLTYDVNSRQHIKIIQDKNRYESQKLKIYEKNNKKLL